MAAPLAPVGTADEKLQLAKAALDACDGARCADQSVQSVCAHSAHSRRFALELEFVQCLANPHYINWLAQNRYFDDPAFVRFLAYLQYWKQPQYASFITYPHALYFLDLLQDASFRQSMASTTIKEVVHTQQFRHWQHFRDNRMQEAANPQP